MDIKAEQANMYFIVIKCRESMLNYNFNCSFIIAFTNSLKQTYRELQNCITKECNFVEIRKGFLEKVRFMAQRITESWSGENNGYEVAFSAKKIG